MASWVPPRDASNGWWGVAPAGQGVNKKTKFTNTDDALDLPPGQYDVYWAQDYDHGSSPMLIAKDVAVGDQGRVALKVDSGLQLDVASWVPGLDPSNGWWGAVPTGQKPDKRINWMNAPGALLLPPGAYDVYWVGDYGHGSSPMLLAKGVSVEAGAGPVKLEANSGLEVVAASWVAPLDPSNGWWGAVPTGQKPSKRVNWTNAPGPLLLPPGSYDVYWAQDYDHGASPMLLAKGMAVKAGAGPVQLAVDSGIEVKAASWVVPLDPSNGWWGAVPAGHKPNNRINWTNTPRALPLPPGSYDVYWAQDYDHGGNPLLLAGGVQVKQGDLAPVDANSGLRLRLTPGTSPLDKSNGWWGVVPAGETPDDRVAWWAGQTDSPLLAPAGRYDLYWKQDYDHQPQLLQRDVTIEAGQLLELQVQPKP